MHEGLAAHVHGPSHSSEPPKYDWTRACAKIQANNSNPLFARIQWVSCLYMETDLSAAELSYRAHIQLRSELFRHVGAKSSFPRHLLKGTNQPRDDTCHISIILGYRSSPLGKTDCSFRAFEAREVSSFFFLVFFPRIPSD